MSSFDSSAVSIIGDDLQAIILTLAPGAQVVSEAGALMFMDASVHMDTRFGSNADQGLLQKLTTATKRLAAGESLAHVTYENRGTAPARVAFAGATPGKVVPIDLAQWGGRVLAQRGSLLCATADLDISIAFTRRIGSGLFGGAGFLLQALEGDGVACLHASGALHTVDLAPGQRLLVDTGSLVAFGTTVQYEIRALSGVKNWLFRGEGVFLTELIGPGRVLLQTMPLSRLADSLRSALTPKRASGTRIRLG